MSGIRYVAAAVILSVLVSSTATAQEASNSREADHQALRLLMSNITEAVNTQNTTNMMALFTKDFVLTPTHQNLITNREQFFTYYEKMFNSTNGPVAKMHTAPKADVLTKFVDDNNGYCFGSAVGTYTLRDGRVFKINERWSALVTKEEGQWKILMAHMGVNFLDNPVIKYESMSGIRKLFVKMHLAKLPSD